MVTPVGESHHQSCSSKHAVPSRTFKGRPRGHTDAQLLHGVVHTCLSYWFQSHHKQQIDVKGSIFKTRSWLRNRKIIMWVNRHHMTRIAPQMKHIHKTFQQNIHTSGLKASTFRNVCPWRNATGDHIQVFEPKKTTSVLYIAIISWPTYCTLITVAT